jgi:phospholipid/cholesterol/gamma-HCH transport system substrate-binding protein
MNRNQSRLMIELRRARGGLIALAVLVAMALVAVVVLIGGLEISLPWDDTYTARVAVDDAKGVVPGKQQVKISGFPVGKITGLQMVGGRAVLTLEIQGQYAPLYRDAKLRLRPKTPLDDLYLDVTSRGTSSAGKLDWEQILQAQRTIAPVDIGQVLDAFDATTRVRLKQTIDAVGAGLGPHGDEFRAALIKLAPFLLAAQRLTGALAARSTQTAALVHNVRLLTEELGRRGSQLRTLVADGAETFSTLGAEQQPLASVIDQLPPTLQQLLPAFATLRATTDKLDPALDRLQPAADALPSGLAALRSFSLSAAPALAALRRTLPGLRSLVTALQPAAAGLRRDFSLLGPQAPAFDRITSKIVPCELGFDKFFNNTISLSKFYDTGGVTVRGQTVDGIDPNQRAAASCAPGGPGG